MHHPPAAAHHKIAVADLNRVVECGQDEDIYHALRRSAVRIVGACGGRGACGSCTVRLVHGRALVDNARIVHGGRRWLRACRLKPRQDCEIEIAPRSLAPIARADVELPEWPHDLEIAPAVTAHDIAVAAPTLADPNADSERARAQLPRPSTSTSLAAARALPAILRENSWRARLIMRDDVVIAAMPPGRRPLGLAVDLGTTNAVGVLVDLTTGRPIARLGIENPQVAWGADVVTRLNHAISGDEQAEELRAAATRAINALAADLALAVGQVEGDIVDVVVCGNTAMQHLLLGLPVRQLGRAPFVAAHTGALDVAARELDLDISASARVQAAPGVGGFVGSDHVATLLATRARWTDGCATLVMDIGTNTEISLIHGGRILSASCPSGPALEGGQISCGMRAAEGAIERVTIVDGRLVSATIGEAEAVGLCGSGLLDALACALELGLVDRTGRIRPHGADVLRHDNGHLAIALAPGAHLVQHDIRAVQLAKAAIRTGVDMLLDLAGLAEREVARFLLAGAFGHYIDVASAIRIGLLPPLARETFGQVGNAAGAGAALMLVSTRERETAREIASRCEYVELSTHPQFQKRFMKNIGFNELTGETQT